MGLAINCLLSLDISCIYMKKILIILILPCFLLIACKSEAPKPIRDSINILLPIDPERVNPVYDSRSIAREVFQYIYVPVGDFHPETLELYPILLKNIPNEQKDAEGNSYYEIELIKDAKWSDGKNITAEDYIFTIKSVLLPLSSPRSWKSTLVNINDIQADPDDPYKVKVFVNGQYMLAKEMVSTIYLLPKHVYNNSNVLDNIGIKEIKSMNEEEQPEGMELFLEDFNDQKHYSTNILGNGPYKLDSWETDQYLSLSKVENYWGSEYQENPFLQTNVEKINFKIIADEMTAITALKDGALDIVKGLPAVNFENLKKELPEASYLNAPSTRYYYIAINNQNPLLANVDIRKALASLVNVKAMINNIEFGYGQALTGPIHPSKSEYNENLNDEIFNVTEAKRILTELGWSDTNNNNTVDKVINGKREELELDLLITGGELGQKVALLFQEEATKVGVKINIVRKDIRRMRSENIYTYDYDLAALAEGQDVIPVDPYRRWHSDNVKEKGSNLSGFKSTTTDSLIMLIRNEKDFEKREKLFEEFHQEIYNQQPVIFLFSPTQKIIVGPDFEATVTAKRPGYLANTFKIKSAKK